MTVLSIIHNAELANNQEKKVIVCKANKHPGILPTAEVYLEEIPHMPSSPDARDAQSVGETHGETSKREMVFDN